MAERLTYAPTLPTTSQELYAQFKDHPNLPEFEIVTGNGNIPLAEEVGALLDKPVYKAVKGYFADGAPIVQIPQSVRRKDVFIMQSEAPNPTLAALELEDIVDAARRASSDRRTAVLPYMAFAREDKRLGRQPISAARRARNLIHSGFQSLLTVDLHNEATMGAIDEPWDNVYATPALIPAMIGTGLTDVDIATADASGAKRGEPFLNRMPSAKNMAVLYKRHTDDPNETKALFIAGNVEGRDLWVVEDMIDTAGSAANAAYEYKKHGARSVNIVATHGLLSRKGGQSAVERIENSAYDRVIITDSILQDEATQREIAESSKIQVVSIAPILAIAILCNLTGESIGERLIK